VAINAKNANIHALPTAHITQPKRLRRSTVRRGVLATLAFYRCGVAPAPALRAPPRRGVEGVAAANAKAVAALNLRRDLSADPSNQPEHGRGGRQGSKEPVRHSKVAPVFVRHRRAVPAVVVHEAEIRMVVPQTERDRPPVPNPAGPVELA